MTDTETKRKPNRRKRVDEHGQVQKWMKDFIKRTSEDIGVTMTMDQAADAFVNWAFSETKSDA